MNRNHWNRLPKECVNRNHWTRLLAAQANTPAAELLPFRSQRLQTVDAARYGNLAAVAVPFAKVDGRVLAPGLAEEPRLPEDLVHRGDLARAWRQLDRSPNQFTKAALIAA